VLGHTDSDGEAEANRLLSEARALNVVEALIAHGVPRERVEAIGKGESQPRASNSTPQGKAMNRRTEFVLVEQ
jgi:outer membrane protein OmpA-like peptidoglycan-associated protein